MKQFIIASAIVLGAASCGGDNTKSNVEAPGTDKDAKSKMLEAGADLSGVKEHHITPANDVPNFFVLQFQEKMRV